MLTLVASTLAIPEVHELLRSPLSFLVVSLFAGIMGYDTTLFFCSFSSLLFRARASFRLSPDARRALSLE